MKNIIISAITGLTAAIIFTLANNYIYRSSIGVVNLEDVLAWNVKNYGEKIVPVKERDEAAEKFARALDYAIKNVSEKHNVTLFVQPAIVSGVPNYTQEIKDIIDGEINGNSKSR